MKGREAGGRGAFSTGDGLGSAKAWRGPGSRRPRRPSALCCRFHLPWSRMVRGERKVSLSVGWAAANEFHLEGGRGAGAYWGKQDLRCKLGRLQGTQTFHFTLSPPLRPGFSSPISLLPLKLGVRCEKLHCATQTQSPVD